MESRRQWSIGRWTRLTAWSALVAAGAYLLMAVAGRREARAAPQSALPNIVFVLTDDQGYADISAHGHPVLKTPNVDRLRSQSARFTDFHVSPTCSPTRSALMTGRHEFRNGVTAT